MGDPPADHDPGEESGMGDTESGTETENGKAPRLLRTEAGLALTDGRLSLMADFAPMERRVKQGTIGTELLVRAARLKTPPKGRAPTLLDATAGLGEDAFLLAASGFTVTMYERNGQIAALLSDALERAADIPGLSGTVSRMALVNGDSVAAMKTLKTPPDVIYLDPMFPERKKSALVKKKFQLLQKLEMPCPNEEELLFAAIAAKPRKIVVKRPTKGPFLAGIRPDYSLSGSSVRYDCLILT